MHKELAGILHHVFRTPISNLLMKLLIANYAPLYACICVGAGVATHEAPIVVPGASGRATEGRAERGRTPAGKFFGKFVGQGSNFERSKNSDVYIYLVMVPRVSRGWSYREPKRHTRASPCRTNIYHTRSSRGVLRLWLVGTERLHLIR